jgi:hypothetical protein
METDNDTQEGGEGLSIDEAAAAYAKATTEEVQEDQSEAEETDEGDTTDDELQASDEEAGDEDEGETEAEDQAEEGDEEDEPESDQGRFVADNAKVRLADGTVTTIAELKAGSLRNGDYTRKTQELAEQRRTVESQSERIKASEQQVNEQAQYVRELLTSIIPQAPDASLTDPRSPNFDPVRYQNERAQYEQWTQHLQFLDQQKQQTEQARQAEAEKGMQERLAREWELAQNAIPELKSPEKLKAFGQEVLKFGATYGYSEEELATAHYDHRQLLVLKKAIAWDKLQQSKSTVAKKVEGRPPVQKGGKRLNPQAQRARAANDAISRLKSSGSVEDAAAAYLASRKG